MIREHQNHIKNLAEALLQKETLDITDIIEVLGQRPFPFGDSLTDYLKEIENRKEEARKRKEEEELKKKEEEEKKLKESENAETKTEESAAVLENTEEKAKEEIKEENKETKKE